MTYERHGWEQMSDTQRGEFIRAHARGDKPVPPDGLRKLFQLSEAGLVLILQGAPWRPEHHAQVPLREATAADLGIEE